MDDDTIAIDGHVHLYPEMDPARFLTSAADNLGRISGGAGGMALLFTETSRDDAFARLVSGAIAPAGWRVRSLPDDPAALLAEDGAGRRVVLVAGRQIVTAEGIEVLALATVERFLDRRSVDAVLADLRAAHIPAVLPWGLGKWFGRRGRIVADLARAGPPGLALGDNAGRPRGWPSPRIFRDGTLPVLPGTDPLPIRGSEANVGGYGFTLPARLDPARPAADLAARLFSLGGQPAIVGGRHGPVRAMVGQLALRRAKSGGADN